MRLEEKIKYLVIPNKREVGKLKKVMAHPF